MPRFLRAGFIDKDALLAGRWRGPLQALNDSPEPPERPSSTGAAMAADWIDRRLAS
jgi:hypothetical protein